MASASVTIHVTKLAEGVTGMRLAELQHDRAQVQEDHFKQLIDVGLSGWEQTGLGALAVAAGLHAAGGIVSTVLGFGRGALSEAAAAAATAGQAALTYASFKRRK